MAQRAQPFTKRINRWFRTTIRSKRFAPLYLMIASVVLGVTTVVWATIGAFIQSSNADQLANTLLLENNQTITGALLPSQHTFLLKIPLFWLVTIFGADPSTFVIATVVLCLLTVGGLAFILWRIERRPLVLGTIFLALAAVLLYIPAQSYPGSLLPANYAMLTTRNIEYVLFIGALILFIKAKRFRSLAFVGGGLAMALLLASDRLFVSLGVGTAVISGLLFFILKRRDLIRIAVRILIGMVVGYIVASILLFILTRVGLHFDSGSAVGPYGFVTSPKNFVIALVYGVLGIATNLGANPMYDALAIKDIPAHFVTGLVSPAGPGYIATVAILVAIIRGSIIAFRQAIKKPRARQKPNLDWQVILPVVLLTTVVSAFGVFVISNHYYPADSRYLAIALPAGFIALASAYRKIRFKQQRLVALGGLAVIAIIFGILFQIQNNIVQNRALGDINHRNEIIADALKAHPVSTLLGNYWRVLPIRINSPTLTVTPLETCTTPRKVLDSTNWQPNLHKTSFAYILQLDGGLADTPSCDLQQVTTTYGRPDSSIVIAGTRTHPKELLLFFDEGIHFLKTPTENNTANDTVTPISIDTMPFTTCPTTTVMQFVAHEDDDILFMNPDLTHSIKDGDCIRTVYVTAGDAGSNQLYWLGRQHGAEAAYNTILGTPNLPWTERVVALDATHTLTVANPRGNHNISLIFMHLPDGNPFGTGFANDHFESLRKLYTRAIPAEHTVDNSGETYTYGDLTSALTHLMTVYRPSQLRSQSTFSGSKTQDHSDHNAVGEFATLAYKAYQQTNPDAAITYYLGYPVHDRPANITGDDYSQKVSTFLSFGQFDAATCHSLAACNNDAVYGNYLARQYTYPY